MKRDTMLLLLLNLYYDMYEDDLEYENVDDFYAYIGYNLEGTHFLEELGICSTSALMNELQTISENM